MTISKILFIFFSFLLGQQVLAENYHGRFTFGSFIAKETFKESTAGIFSNDFNIVSSRFYLHLSEIGKGQYSFITDLRDKHDFFNKLDRERLELVAKNRLQVRQFYLKYGTNQKTYHYKLGRFAVIEAGSIYLDGVQAGLNAFDTMDFTLFAGLNPKQEVEGNLEFETNALNKGLSAVYFKKKKRSGGYYYIANAVVEQTYDGEVDRRFLFHNSIVQTDHYHRFSSLLYFDLVPTAKIQNLWLNYWQNLKNNYSYSLNANRVDVIEYTRRRGIRETLPSSSYDEFKLKLKYKKKKGLTTNYKLSHGKRQVDGLTKSVVEIGWFFNRFLKKRMNSYINLGYKKNFTSNDIFSKLGIGYFSKNWEYSVDQEIILEETAGVTNLPTITELIASYSASRSLFTSVSLQYARDNKVTILSTFFKLSYRFGNKEVAPIRDGAPLQGKL